MSSSNSHLEEKTIFGFWIFLMSDAVLFATLFAVYAVFQTTDPQVTIGLTSLPRALFQTLCLLGANASIFGVFKACRKEQKGATLGWLITALILGGAFFIALLGNFKTLLAAGISWETHAGLSAFFNLLGTLGIHAAIGLLWISVMMGQLMVCGFTPAVQRRVSCLRLFWHFVNIVWIFIFTFVDLIWRAAV